MTEANDGNPVHVAGATSSSPHNKATTICAVCREESDNHHIHYGALACFSCRAFFRRAHNRGPEAPNYLCKQDGGCDITFKNRKKCQKCRYDKCVEVGMNPGLVLTQDQKKIRFRKMYEKKSRSHQMRKRSNDDRNAGRHPSSGEDEVDVDDDAAADEGDPRFASPPTRTRLSHHDIDVGDIKREIFGQFDYNKGDDNLAAGPSNLNAVIFRQILDRATSSGGSSTKSTTHPIGRIYHQPHSRPFYLAHQPETAVSQLQRQQQPQQSRAPPSFAASPPPPDVYSYRHRIQITQESIAIINAYFEFAVSSVPLDKDVECRILEFQYGDKSSLRSYDRDENLRAIISCLRERFRFFAYQFDLFKRLHHSDQVQLFSHNVQLFIQYVVCRYVAAEEGYEQLLWILGTKDNLIPDMMSTVPACKTPLEMLPSASYKDLASYSSLAKRVSNLGLQRRHNPIVAAIFLFAQVDETIALSSATEIQTIEDELIKFISDPSQAGDNFIPGEKVDELIDCMHVIVKFYTSAMETKGGKPKPSTSGETSSETAAEDKDDDDGDDEESELGNLDELSVADLWVPNPPSSSSPAAAAAAVPPSQPHLELEMPYTREEENWLKKQLENFNEAYHAVSLGSDLINEFVMYTFDVPLSKSFIPNELSAFNERCRRILKIHPEFNALTDDEQREVCRENCVKAAALCSVKSESYDSGNKQLEFCLGKDDETEWTSNYLPRIKTEIKKVMISDWNVTSNALDTESLLTYLQLSGSLTTTLEDSENFKLIALMALFSGKTGNANQALRLLEKRYSTLLQRRAAAAASNDGSDKNKKKSKSSYAKICRGIDGIDELSRIFKQLQCTDDDDDDDEK